MKQKWKGEEYKKLVWKCASATTVQYFDRAMDKLKKLDEEAYDYLRKIPAQHWSRSHFSGNVILYSVALFAFNNYLIKCLFLVPMVLLNVGRAHCDVLLNNLCEVFNRQLLDGRDAPILTALEFVREYLMKRIIIP